MTLTAAGRMGEFQMKRSLMMFCVVLSLLLVFSSFAFAFTSEERELAIKVGQRLSSHAFSRGGGSAPIDRWLQRQIESIFWDIAREAARMVDLPYSLHILGSNEPDAWSYCDGSVYITMGIVRQLEYSNEYAALFGHLIAHVVRQHHIGVLLETEEGKAFLKDIADGKVGVTQSELGKFAVYLLSTTYSKNEEDEADSLGSALAQLAGYGRWGLETAYSKIAAYSSTSAFFQTHPHPGVQPYVWDDPRPELPDRTGLVDDGVRVDVEPETSSVRIPVEMFAEFGRYPFIVESGEAVLHYRDSNGGPGDDYCLQLQQSARSNMNVLGFGLTLGIIKPFYVSGSFGFGLQDGVFKGSTRASTSMMQLGVGMDLGTESTSLRVGGFWGTLHHSCEVGKVQPKPDGTGADEMILYDYYRIPHGTPIVASCSGSGFGAFASFAVPISGDSVSLVLTARYLNIIGRGYEFTVNDTYNRTVKIPYEGEYPKPFVVQGVAISGGIKIRF